MKTGNVILADGKIGVLTHWSDQLGFDPSPTVNACGVYFDGNSFSVDTDTCIVLDLCLNDHINRHVKRCGKVKIARKNREN